MYKDYFRLTDSPFSIAPDPRFLYMSARHREAIAHLLFGVGGDGGLVLLTGEIGAGKTTLCRRLIEQIHSACDVAVILNAKLSVEDLLETICNEFGIKPPNGWVRIKALVDAINIHLLKVNAAGRRAVLIIDEAQNLHPAVLEQLRLLTNLETNTRKLLQIVLIGQPELNDMLARPEMRQVAQRIVARYHLSHLTRNEVAAYVNHRLRVAGTQAPLFPAELSGQLYRATHGVPRLINLVCDRALLGTYVRGKLQVTPQTLRQAAKEVFGAAPAASSWLHFGRRPALLGTLGAAATVAAIALAHGPSAPPAAGITAVTPNLAAAPQNDESLPNVATAAPTAEPEQFASLHWPADVAARNDSERLGLRDLFALYGLDYDAQVGGDACQNAAAAGMRCFRSRGGLADLRRFNQPALLSMADDGKLPYHAVLVALDDQAATFSVAGSTQRVRLADLALAWSGNFTLLWQQPAGFAGPLSLGSHGPAVGRLRQDLARVQGENADGPIWFDDQLRRQVKKFQLTEGITPDGVAGVLTMIRLGMRLDDRMPRLTRSTQDRDVLHS